VAGHVTTSDLPVTAYRCDGADQTAAITTLLSTNTFAKQAMR
jgi:hypothetical protein